MKTISTITLVCALAATAFAQGTTSLTRSYNLPPVGLGSTETAQVNLVNTVTSSAGTSSASSPACTGTISFADASGKAIGSPVSFTTSGSQVFSTQLMFSQLGVTGTRGEFVGSIQLTTALPADGSRCSLTYSLETFDTSTGATHVYLSNALGAGAVLRFLPGGLH